MKHEESLICQVTNPRDVLTIPSADNRSCVLVYDHDVQATGLAHRIQFNGMNWVQTLGNHSLSFDGTKFAMVGHAPSSRLQDIWINGKPVYRSQKELIHALYWISNDQLAWQELSRTVDGTGIDTYVNGENVTGRISIEGRFPRRGMPHVILQENGIKYGIDEDGTRTSLGPVPTSDDEAIEHPQKPRPEVARAIRDDVTGQVRMAYRNMTGPEFDDLKDRSGMCPPSYTSDRTSVGYVGVRYSPLARTLVGVAGALANAGSNTTEANWVTALLFNPYFGSAHIMCENSRRFFPTVNDREWKKGYAGVLDHFFTPAGAFVVLVEDGGGNRVVVDEEEGPIYDQILHVRWLEAERCLCYLARRGNEYFFRVTAS